MTKGTTLKTGTTLLDGDDRITVGRRAAGMPHYRHVRIVRADGSASRVLMSDDFLATLTD